MSEQPGRYQRSTAGLIGALLVTVLALLVFVGFRSLFRDQNEVPPQNIDYAEAARGARDAGFAVIAPSQLPEGWVATSVDLKQTRPPVWGIGMLTDDERYAGVRQQDESVSRLVETFIDEDAVEGDPIRLENSLDPSAEWLTFTDDGGDTGYLLELPEEAVLVYGSAPAEDLRELVALLER